MSNWNIPENGDENINFNKVFTTGQVKNLLAQKVINLDTPICRAGHIYAKYPHKGKKDIRRVRFHTEFAPLECPVPPEAMFAVFGKSGKIKHFLTRNDFSGGVETKSNTIVLDITYYPENMHPVFWHKCKSFVNLERYFEKREERKEERERQKEFDARMQWELSRTWWDRTTCGEGLFGWIYNCLWLLFMFPIFLIIGIFVNLDDVRFGSAENRRDRDYWTWMNKNVR
jgi:hypothetical protein